MKKALWGGLVLMLAARSFAGVFISEYIEGSATNKALEIYNGTGSTINMMNDYRLGLASNGAAAPTMFQFNKNVAPGDVFVVANGASAAAILAVADTLSNGFANWNGDDFVGLYQMVAGSPVLIDVIGVLGTDPGTSWTVAGDTGGSLNHTMNRKATVTQGNSNWTLSAGTNAGDSEWIINAVDTFTNLGVHFMDVGTPILSNLAYLPESPHSTDAVTVSVNATDNVSLTSVNLVYTVDGGAAQTVAMVAGTPPAYSYVIPAQADLAVVAFHVEATDNESNTTSSGTLSYTVHDSFPCADIATIRANDANGSPLLLGAVRSVCGVVTMSNQLGAAGPIYITGTTGSVALYGAGFVTGVTIGDEVQATGTVGFYNGLTEFVTPTFLNIVSHPGEPTPVATTLADLISGGESWEAQLVHVTGLELDPASVWPALATNGTVTVTNGAETFTVFIDRDTDIDGSPAPSGTFELTAIIGQFDAATPYFEAYQLIPRSLADFTFTGNQPPSISALARLPYVPSNTESVSVTALVVDDVALTSVSLFYQVNGGGFVSTPMSVVSGNTYGASIPAQADGAVVDYYVQATDATETSTGATQSYTVFAVFPCADLATLHVNDAEGRPTLLNTTQYICGVLTCGTELGVGGPFYLVNETGSLALFGGAFNSTTAVIGDEIEAVATVGFYNGLTEMINSPSVVVTGHPGAPMATSTTLAAINAAPESFEAMFVRLDACTLVDALQWPVAGSNADVTIAQGVDTFVLHIDRDTNVDESSAPVGAFSVQGLIGQYDTATPWDANYQITPRMATDIMTTPDAPVVTISYSSGNATLSWPAVPGATDYKVFTSASPYDGWDAGVSTAGATSHIVAASGKLFFQVVAVN